MFVGLTIGVIIIIGGLTFFPAVRSVRSSSNSATESSSNDRQSSPLTTTTQPDQPGPASAPHGVAESRSLFDGPILRQALVDSFTKLNPAVQVRNPGHVRGAVGTIITFFEAIAHPSVFTWSITIWLFLTVIFANFAEAMAEGRGKAQADTLRKMRSETEARRLNPTAPRSWCRRGRAGQGGPRRLRGQRPHPLRRRDHRGHRLGRRVGHHR
jgi:hypothetical protein